jgi:hypothetical protein
MGQDIRELLSEVAGTSISGHRRVPRYCLSLIWLPAYRLKNPPQRAVAQRLCALARTRSPGERRRFPVIELKRTHSRVGLVFDPDQKLP